MKKRVISIALALACIGGLAIGIANHNWRTPSQTTSTQISPDEPQSAPAVTSAVNDAADGAQLQVALVENPLDSTAQGAEPADPVAPPLSTVDEQPVLPHCLVALIAEVQVPAQEAGVLRRLEAKEGMQVSEGMVLGNIDDTIPQVQREIKLAEAEAAELQATDKVEIKFATAAAGVAKFTHERHRLANAAVPNAVAEVELKRLALDFERARLGIEQAGLKQRIAAATARAKAAEARAAQLDIERRSLKSPFDGIVDKIHRRVGEWVQAGDPVVRIFRFDRLHVKGTLDEKKYAPHEVSGKPVNVEIELARGRRVTLPGKIMFVSPEVRLEGGYEVWAEIRNVRENAEWVVRPGMPATMTIQLGRLTNATAAAPARAR